jgi:hypothetical protein
MTADVSLEQFVHLKQPACDYLSQVYEISYQLNDLIEALKNLLSLIQEYARSSHALLDKGYIPVKDLEDLYICQIQGIKYLRLAAKEFEAFNGFEIYSKALVKLEVVNG